MSSGGPGYRLGAHTRRSADGRVLVGGWPPRRVGLSAAGNAALDAALGGRPDPGAARLVRRLVDYGMVDPVAGPAGAEVTFVIPVRDGGPALGRLVADLTPFGAVIVVDDGSRDDSAALARRAGAAVVPNEDKPGPGGARNTGWRRATTEFVAFVDGDCLIDGDWARPLAQLLADDPGLAIAAPRVRGAEGPGRLARWERLRSPLDMGTAGGLVGPGRRVPYVPAAALVARRSVLSELGGFDGSLRFGEDVDLIWRAVDGGHSVRYAPEVQIRHPPRPTLGSRARQHFDYGTSAAALEQRHPGCAVPLRPNRLTSPAVLLAGGSPHLALVAATAFSMASASRAANASARLAIGRLSFDAQFAAGRELARACSRDWLPLTLLLATRPGRPRRAALLLLTVDLLAATRGDPTGIPVNALLRLADNAAYCAGLWSGAAARRSPWVTLPRRAR